MEILGYFIVLTEFFEIGVFYSVLGIRSGRECLLFYGFVVESYGGLGIGFEDRFNWVFFLELLFISFIILCKLIFLSYYKMIIFIFYWKMEIKIVFIL